MKLFKHKKYSALGARTYQLYHKDDISNLTQEFINLIDSKITGQVNYGMNQYVTELIPEDANLQEIVDYYKNSDFLVTTYNYEIHTPKFSVIIIDWQNGKRA